LTVSGVETDRVLRHAVDEEDVAVSSAVKRATLTVRVVDECSVYASNGSHAAIVPGVKVGTVALRVADECAVRRACNGGHVAVGPCPEAAAKTRAVDLVGSVGTAVVWSVLAIGSKVQVLTCTSRGPRGCTVWTAVDRRSGTEAARVKVGALACRGFVRVDCVCAAW
jgi:hypothetical protein